MKTAVGVVKGNDKICSFNELVAISGFDAAIDAAHKASKKDKSAFKIVIKPNMMVFVNPVDHTAVVTDKDLVERLVDHIRERGFTDIAVCEARNDAGRLIKNHTVAFVARQIGYDPRGRYRIVDLTLESRPFTYEYLGRGGKVRQWKDSVGETWRDADFRISFAKCKSHDHDWMTLSIKNVYGCFPAPDKVELYHIKQEVWDVTGYSIRNFPVHFAFVDAWIGSDGPQGYKIPHPIELRMLFGSPSAIAVDMEVVKRCGLYNENGENDRRRYRLKMLHRAVVQDRICRGSYPEIEVRGDQSTKFSDWENITPALIEDMNAWEENIALWAFISLKVAAKGVDYSIFPPKNIGYRLLTFVAKILYLIISRLPFYRKLYGAQSAA